MNVARLYELVTLLLALESETKFQKKLTAVSQRLERLVNEPHVAEAQNEFVKSKNELVETEQKVMGVLEPAQQVLAEEIGATEYFVEDYSSAIDREVRENPLSPAVARDKLKTWIERRAEYVSRLTPMIETLKAMGVKPISLAPGEAEIGFLLPRSLFNNRLNDLIKELRDVNHIIRVFSELATGSPEEVQVRDISSSDPQFFFGLEVATIVLVGGAVTWALHTWEKVEHIRKARAEVRKINVMTDAELDSLFDTKIKQHLDTSLEQKVSELIAPLDGKSGRTNEQRNDLAWALKSILAHVERSMLVELRFVPPPAAPTTEGVTAEATQADPSKIELYQKLEALKLELLFPPVGDPPILNLPPQPGA